MKALATNLYLLAQRSISTRQWASKYIKFGYGHSEHCTYISFDVALDGSGEDHDAVVVYAGDHTIEDFVLYGLECDHVKADVEDHITGGVLNHAL